MNMILSMIKNMIPTEGHYQISFHTLEEEKGKIITIQFGLSQPPKRIATIHISIPK